MPHLGVDCKYSRWNYMLYFFGGFFVIFFFAHTPSLPAQA